MKKHALLSIFILILCIAFYIVLHNGLYSPELPINRSVDSQHHAKSAEIKSMGQMIENAIPHHSLDNNDLINRLNALAMMLR